MTAARTNAPRRKRKKFTVKEWAMLCKHGYSFHDRKNEAVKVAEEHRFDGHFDHTGTNYIEQECKSEIIRVLVTEL